MPLEMGDKEHMMIFTHTFDQPGEYSASLSVEDSDGSMSDFAEDNFIVYLSGNSPAASFMVTPDEGTTNTTFTFNASGSSDVETPDEQLRVRWDWDSDGEWDTEPTTVKQVQHQFSIAGTHTVTLLGIDGDDAIDQVSKEVPVVAEFGDPCPGIPEVVYEGETYPTVQIGYQCWLKKNLNVGTMIINTALPANNQEIEKYCYDNDESFCDTYGGLYNWDEAMDWSEQPGSNGICPEGWRIPTGDDWDDLADILGGPDIAGEKMKPLTDDWLGVFNNTNESGFTALPGGSRTYYNPFDLIGEGALFWSSNQNMDDTFRAYLRSVYYSTRELNN